MPGPIHGVKVLELAQIMAGPTCGLMLADLGAEVVLVRTQLPCEVNPAASKVKRKHLSMVDQLIQEHFAADVEVPVTIVNRGDANKKQKRTAYTAAYGEFDFLVKGNDSHNGLALLQF